jgi:lipid-binding SYLF domain-containing protein
LRNGDNWSAPAGITMEAGSLGIEIGENIDIVISNKALYGKPIENGEIVEGGAATPAP